MTPRKLLKVRMVGNVRRVRLNNGGYDRSGKYWGAERVGLACPGPLYVATFRRYFEDGSTEDGDAYKRAQSLKAARAHFRAVLPILNDFVKGK